MNLGLKDDGQKPNLALCDPHALMVWGSVMTHGAGKYGVNNWRLGIAYTRLIAAMLRHIMAFASGEDVDPESGELHMAHVMANASMLISMPKRFDDRYRAVPDGTGAQL